MVLDATEVADDAAGRLEVFSNPLPGPPPVIGQRLPLLAGRWVDQLARTEVAAPVLVAVLVLVFVAGMLLTR